MRWDEHQSGCAVKVRYFFTKAQERKKKNFYHSHFKRIHKCIYIFSRKKNKWKEIHIASWTRDKNHFTWRKNVLHVRVIFSSNVCICLSYDFQDECAVTKKVPQSIQIFLLQKVNKYIQPRGWLKELKYVICMAAATGQKNIPLQRKVQWLERYTITHARFTSLTKDKGATNG